VSNVTLFIRSRDVFLDAMVLTLATRTILGSYAMADHDSTPTEPLRDDVLVALADELHRLVVGLKRDLRRNAVLPSLSDLTAMRPLQAMLTEALSSRVQRSHSGDSDIGEEISHDGTTPGYL